ncbi:MAG: hypothetical protein ACPGID_01480, partial [Rubricella sp.]
MTNALKAAVLATVTALVALPATANVDQLAASAGLSPAEAQGLSVSEIIAIKGAGSSDFEFG